ncbi:D-alanine--D-alanine ligase family protein [Kribbella sp. NPDC051770]|uniref:D-alanine--D-alanine ligase family protein n=1 Tax=Kribbella sp. NPDC051770 TaxID=3155413 RepID=UPI00341B259F
MKVAVIMGGVSPEHEVSLASGNGIAAAATELGHSVVQLVIERDGSWRDGQHEAIELLQDCDVAVPALHGQGGEDGVIQGFLDQLRVPYVGSGVAASAVGLAKPMTKAVLRAYGLPVTPGITLHGADLRDPEAAHQQLKEAGIEFPVFVKPGNGGSSYGVTRVTDAAALAEAIVLAAGLDGQVLVEQEMRGREIDLAVMEFPDGRVDAGPALEIHSTPEQPFFNTTAKYSEGAGEQFAVPAPLDADLAATLRRTAVEVFETLGCAGLARVDFFVPADGRPVVNEINTFPGFTPASQFPLMWAAAGMSYADVVQNLLETARARAAE